jgi:hypothetical protein
MRNSFLFWTHGKETYNAYQANKKALLDVIITVIGKETK